MNETQKRTAMAIVNIFETGTVSDGYGAVTRSAGDAGHLSYGRSQASLASGSLYRLVDSYCRAGEARCAEVLTPYLDRLRRCDQSLDGDQALCDALREAAGDPVMRTVQDRHFETAYFEPACAAAQRADLRTPLAQTVAYDSFIQGGWNTVKRLALAKAGPVSAEVTETAWLSCYIDARREWLKSLGGLAARTTYRMDEFERLVEAGKFQLELPLRVRGVTIDEAAICIQKEAAGQLESHPAA